MTSPPDRTSRWSDLAALTPARVALGRAGAGLPTAAHLAFQADHAAARDAVHAPLDVDALARALDAPSLRVESAAASRAEYLRRPDLGRRLRPGDAATLASAAGPWDLAIVLGDGLSAGAVQRHGAGLVAALRPRLEGISLASPVIATGARVALGDAIAEALGARAVLILIGERPGLSSPESLGAYLTWNPKPGLTTNAERNCVSNIHDAGLSLEEAADTIARLIARMRAVKATGISLKDDDPPLIEAAAPAAIDASPSMGRVKILETLALRAWPALEVEPLGGWVLRAARGLTKRANSVNALRADAEPLGPRIARAEAFYRERGLPPCFRVTPLCEPDLDADLSARGYRRMGDSRVMVHAFDGAGSNEAASDPDVALGAVATEAWLSGFCAAEGYGAAERGIVAEIVSALAPRSAFATLGADAFGRAVVEAGTVGLFSIVTAPEARRRGLARRLSRALLAWGRQAGARQAYLQVEADNAAAVALYAELGFTPLYAYHYRVLAP